MWKYVRVKKTVVKALKKKVQQCKFFQIFSPNSWDVWRDETWLWALFQFRNVLIDILEIISYSSSAPLSSRDSLKFSSIDSVGWQRNGPLTWNLHCYLLQQNAKIEIFIIRQVRQIFYLWSRNKALKKRSRRGGGGWGPRVKNRFPIKICY